MFCVFTSLVLYLGFGLSDFIFNSPKQMIFLFLLLGLTQSISYCYDKTVITDARTLERAARKEIRNTLKPISKSRLPLADGFSFYFLTKVYCKSRMKVV